MASDRQFTEFGFLEIPREQKTFFDWTDDVSTYPGKGRIPLLTLEVDPKQGGKILALEEYLTLADYFGFERWENEIYPHLVQLFEEFYVSEGGGTAVVLESLGEFFATKGFGHYLESLAKPEGHLLRSRAFFNQQVIWILNSEMDIHRPRLYYPGLVREFKRRYLSERV